MVGGQVVLFDEPTESIDERGRDAIYKLIAELINREKTVIISSQDKEIINIADIKINLDKKPVPEITERK